MDSSYIFPGTFSPPTYGHLDIVRRAAAMFPEVLVICSENPEKIERRWFSPWECANMWCTYQLPKNVRVTTLDVFKACKPDLRQAVMIRGIRNEADFEHEKKVAFYNRQEFGIDKYFYLLTGSELSGVSSSAARAAAQSLRLAEFPALVSPLIVSSLLELTLTVKNVFLVVGKPGGGKSTFLKLLQQINPLNVHVSTDPFSQQLRPVISQAFPGEDPVEVALKNPEKLKQAIGSKWLELAAEQLRQLPDASNVFIEAAYGLMPDKSLYRFFGGKVLFVGCDDEVHRQRTAGRGTPQLLPFIDSIPGLQQSREIAEHEKLKLTEVNTAGSLEELEQKARELDAQLDEEGIDPWKRAFIHCS